MQNLGPFFIARLKEPSTWQGISAILTAAGVYIAPDLWQAIVGVGVAVGGLLAVVIPEGKAQ